MERETFIRQKYVLKAFVHPHPNFKRPEIPVPPPKVQGTLLSAAAANSPPRALRGGLSPRTTRSPIPFTSSPRTLRSTLLHSRPVSMAVTLDSRANFTESLPAISTRGVVPLLVNGDAGAGSDGTHGGMNIRPESMALLEANWKKLEKSGKLQKWNFSRVTSVRPPKMNFSFSKFARPGSFRRRQNTKDSELSHSDNELDKDSDFPTTSHHVRADQRITSSLTLAPPKPPRTYTTIPSDLEKENMSASLLFPDEQDDFSSDLLNTFRRLGSVYSLSGMTGENDDARDSREKTSQSVLHLPASTGVAPQHNGMTMPRSASAMSSLGIETRDSSPPDSTAILEQSPTSSDVELEESAPSGPRIAISNSADCLLSDASAQDVLPRAKLLQNRELSRSMDSLVVLKADECLYRNTLQTLLSNPSSLRGASFPPSPIATATAFVCPNKEEDGSQAREEEEVERVDGPESSSSPLPPPLHRRENSRENLTNLPLVEEEGLPRLRVFSTGSLDSFTTAHDNVYTSSVSSSPSPECSSVDVLIRPDSSASDLFETPPNSLDNPSPLRQAMMANAPLFPAISLQDTGSSESFHVRELSDATVTVGRSLSDSISDDRQAINDGSDDSHTPYPSPMRRRRPLSGSLLSDDVFGGNIIMDSTDATDPLSGTDNVEQATDESSSVEKEAGNLDLITESEFMDDNGEGPSGRQSQESNFEPVIIPDKMHPTRVRLVMFTVCS